VSAAEAFDHPAVGAVDRIGEAVAGIGRGNPRLDQVFYALSEAGNHSALWHGINLLDATVGAAIVGGRGPGAEHRRRARRRNALRRSAVLVAEQVIVNGVVKSRFRRGRPQVVEAHPHDLRTPLTSSFPSGHASAGSCAATMLSADVGGGPIWWALALGVAWSRVHVGAHHASDVAGGLGVGTSAARVALTIWPTRR